MDVISKNTCSCAAGTQGGAVEQLKKAKDAESEANKYFTITAEQN